MTGIMNDLASTSRQRFVKSRLRFSLVIFQKSKYAMFELDCVNLNDKAKNKYCYVNFMSFGLYSGNFAEYPVKKKYLKH